MGGRFWTMYGCCGVPYRYFFSTLDNLVYQRALPAQCTGASSFSFGRQFCFCGSSMRQHSFHGKTCAGIAQGGMHVHTLRGWTLHPNQLFCRFTPAATSATCLSFALLFTSLIKFWIILHLNTTLIHIGAWLAFQHGLRSLVVDLVVV